MTPPNPVTILPGDVVTVTATEHPFARQRCRVQRHVFALPSWPDDLLWLVPDGAGETMTFRIFANQVKRIEATP